MKLSGTALLAVATLFCGPPAWASDTRVGAGTEIGTGFLGTDGFVDVSPQLWLQSGAWQLGLGAPVRYRVLDGEPADGCKTPGLRCQDWDEVSDFGRILRFFDYGGWSGDVSVHLGDLTGVSLGHGELVYRYYNNWQYDTWHAGALVDVQKPDFGFSLLTNDVLRWDLLALRAWGRPVGEGFWRKLRFGLQAAWDRELTGSDGLEAPTARDDGPWRPDAPALAMDLSLLAWGDDRRALTTYLSLSGHAADALAVHLGLSWHRRGEFAAVINLEGRVVAPFGSPYLPGWFGTLYELQTRSLRGPIAGNAQATDKATAGVRASVEWARAHKFRFAGVVDWLHDRRLDATAWFGTDPNQKLQINAMVAKVFFDNGPGDPVDWTGNLAARLWVQGPWYAQFAVGRKWRVRPAVPAGTSPLYSEFEVRLAVGADLRW
ncbi:MAG: hypothetical protein FJ100_01750 [Deltaproteobacteria bacterium]|nr:hypothetical protein [Deltaproteobacteria bacterium]